MRHAVRLEPAAATRDPEATQLQAGQDLCGRRSAVGHLYGSDPHRVECYKCWILLLLLGAVVVAVLVRLGTAVAWPDPDHVCVEMVRRTIFRM